MRPSAGTERGNTTYCSIKEAELEFAWAARQTHGSRPGGTTSAGHMATHWFIVRREIPLANQRRFAHNGYAASLRRCCFLDVSSLNLAAPLGAALSFCAGRALAGPGRHRLGFFPSLI